MYCVHSNSPSFVKEGNLKTVDMRPSVSESSRPSSDFRDDWMDQYEFQVCPILG